MDCRNSPHNHIGAGYDAIHAGTNHPRMLPEMPRRSILRVLGTFDEESCRFFLRETGQAIVPSFPFSIGIEKVYGLLLERYGLGEIADATSVLHELLEDQTSATGIGDDGDVWRSWRHQWRHRNVSTRLLPLISALTTSRTTHWTHLHRVLVANCCPHPLLAVHVSSKLQTLSHSKRKKLSQAEETALLPTATPKRPKVQFLEPTKFSPAGPSNKVDELEKAARNN